MAYIASLKSDLAEISKEYHTYHIEHKITLSVAVLWQGASEIPTFTQYKKN